MSGRKIERSTTTSFHQGTVYGSSDGNPYVSLPVLEARRQWRWDARWLSSVWHSNRPAALRAKLNSGLGVFKGSCITSPCWEVFLSLSRHKAIFRQDNLFEAGFWYTYPMNWQELHDLLARVPAWPKTSKACCIRFDWSRSGQSCQIDALGHRLDLIRCREDNQSSRRG